MDLSVDIKKKMHYNTQDLANTQSQTVETDAWTKHAVQTF